MTIAETIKHIREVYELSQQQLANVMGVFPQAVSNYEHGRHNPKRDQIEILEHLVRITKPDRRRHFKEQLHNIGSNRPGMNTHKRYQLYVAILGERYLP